MKIKSEDYDEIGTGSLKPDKALASSQFGKSNYLGSTDS